MNQSHPAIIESSSECNREKRKHIRRNQTDDLTPEQKEMYRNIDPFSPCMHEPSSIEKQLTLRKRYFVGAPLWQRGDLTCFTSGSENFTESEPDDIDDWI